MDSNWICIKCGEVHYLPDKYCKRCEWKRPEGTRLLPDGD